MDYLQIVHTIGIPMIEYRFKVHHNDMLSELNCYMPKPKIFNVDEHTGEAWIKVTNDEHTTELLSIVKHYCNFSNPKRKLIIKDCSRILYTIYNDDRPTLFE